MPDLSVRSLMFLLAMAESERMSATAEVVEDRAGAEVQTLIVDRLLVPGPNLTSVKAGPGDDEYRPILETDEVNRTVTCFHPDVGFVTLSDECLRTWRLDPGRLAVVIGRQLGLPATFRPEPLVDGLLWSLGTPRLDRTNAPVLFARRLGNEESRLRIRAEMELRRGTKLSIMLTTAQRVNADLVLPAVSKVVPIMDVVDRTSDIVRLDILRLAAIAGLCRPIAVRTELPVECEESGHWIRMNGKTYHFRGMQAQAVRLLYDAWSRQDGWQRVQFILEQVNSTSKQLKWLFKGKDDWQNVIEVEGGNCRLRVDETD